LIADNPLRRRAAGTPWLDVADVASPGDLSRRASGHSITSSAIDVY
jgi:hypothetical protein